MQENNDGVVVGKGVTVYLVIKGITHKHYSFYK